MRQHSFDFLRTFAVVSVLLTHYDLYDLKGINVDIFFVLSGFLVSASFLNDFRDNPQTAFRFFLWKRMAKILPSYYFFLLVVFVFSTFFIQNFSPQNSLSWQEIPQFLFFYRNYAGQNTNWTIDHIWSLCVEEHFYLAFVSVLYFWRKKEGTIEKKILFLSQMAIFLGIFFKMQAIFTDFAEYPSFTHNRLDAFGWGIWFMLQKQATKNNWQRLGFFLLSLFVFIIAFQDTQKHYLVLRIGSPIACIFLLKAFLDVRIFFQQFFYFISQISYNLYLWHLPLMLPCQYFFGKNAVGFGVYFSLSFLIGILTTFFIEKPSRKFMKFVFTKK